MTKLLNGESQVEYQNEMADALRQVIVHATATDALGGVGVQRAKKTIR